MANSEPQPAVATRKQSRVGAWYSETNPLRVIGGCILFFLVIMAGVSAVVFFSAAQFQTRIAELSLNGAPLTIWRIDKFQKNFESWDKNIASVQKIVDDSRSDLTLLNEKVAIRNAGLGARQEKLVTGLIRLQVRIPSDAPQTGAVHTTAPAGAASQNAAASQSVHEIFAVVEFRGRALFAADPASRAEFEGLKRDYDLYVADYTENAGVEATARALKLSLDQKEGDLKSKLGQLSKLFGATTADLAPEFVERIVNVTAELDALATTWRGWVYHVARWTNDMLVLLLVISMGVLGSALHLLAVFVANERQSLSFGEYPLRLAFGAVTAIVVFIIAKAGIPILADTSKLGGNAPINPYFISFLAIVSGLMSDRALLTIQNVAANLLRAGSGPEAKIRYARVSLDDALKQSNRTTDDLVRVSGLTKNETEKLFSGDEPVTQDQQNLISAHLNQRVRDLFSDLPKTAEASASK